MDKNSSVVKDLGKNWARSGTSSFSACHGMPDEILVWARSTCYLGNILIIYIERCKGYKVKLIALGYPIQRWISRMQFRSLLRRC